MIFFLSRATAGKKASELAVGESVWLMENDALTEYFVVQQGNPDASKYTDAAANGTWLLRKDVADWASVDRSDHVSDCKDGTYLAQFPSEVQAAIREVTLPRNFQGVGFATSATSKIHIPAHTELGSTEQAALASGCALEYFIGANNAERIAYLNGRATAYLTFNGSLTVDATAGGSYATTLYISATGSLTVTSVATTVNSSFRIRPMMILDPDTEFNGKNEFVGL